MYLYREDLNWIAANNGFIPQYLLCHFHIVLWLSSILWRVRMRKNMKTTTTKTYQVIFMEQVKSVKKKIL